MLLCYFSQLLAKMSHVILAEKNRFLLFSFFRKIKNNSRWSLILLWIASKVDYSHWNSVLTPIQLISIEPKIYHVPSWIIFWWLTNSNWSSKQIIWLFLDFWWVCNIMDWCVPFSVGPTHSLLHGFLTWSVKILLIFKKRQNNLIVEFEGILHLLKWFQNISLSVIYKKRFYGPI